jgi:hypothetical protein
MSGIWSKPMQLMHIQVLEVRVAGLTQVALCYDSGRQHRIACRHVDLSDGTTATHQHQQQNIRAERQRQAGDCQRGDPFSIEDCTPDRADGLTNVAIARTNAGATIDERL